MRPLLLDLFCGAGGAAMGYWRAGFDVVGVDHVYQPDYPFPFHLADALEFPLDGFDAIHASPPCQSYSAMSNRWGSSHPELIVPTRKRLVDAVVPYVIENVQESRRDMREPIVRLTGEMFGLQVYRPRLFELGGWYTLSSPPPPRGVALVAVYGKPDGRRLYTRIDGSELRAWASIEEGQRALGIDWTDDWHQLREAIPPVFTEWLGTQLLAQLQLSRPIPGPTKELAREPAGDLWCFGERKRLPHDWVLFGDEELSYYDPVWIRECSGCGKDRTAFPGMVW